MRTCAILFFALFAFILPIRAQSTAPATAPSALPGSRILRTFDFEETRLGNFESVPMYWSKVAGRGYPAYSSGAFDRTVFRSSKSSFKLDTIGGSVAYRFSPPPEQRIPVLPDSDYYVLAFARTSKLKHACADITAWFADASGAILPATELHSQPYNPAEPATDPDTWRVLYIYIPGPDSDASGAPPQARSLVLQLGLLQPQQRDVMAGGSSNPGDGESFRPGLGRFEIYQQDIQGSVWFDDIVVFQLPRVSVTVPDAVIGNIFNSNQKLDLDLVVSDLGGAPGGFRNLDVRLNVTDPDGLLFASERWAATTTPEKPWSTRYSRAALPAGLYTATLEIAEAADPSHESDVARDKTIIARRQTRFLYLPAANSNGLDRPSSEFGVGVKDWSGRLSGTAGGGTPLGDPASMADAANIWPTIVRDTRAGLAQLPIWRREMSEEAVTRRDQPFDALLGALQRMDVRTIGAIAELPGALSSRLPPAITDRTNLLALLEAQPALWRPYLNFTLTRYANRIDYWELGTPDLPFCGSIVSSSQSVDLAERYTRLYDRSYGEIAGLLNRPQLLIPWNALFEFDPKQYPHALLDLRIPSIVKPSQIPAYVENFRQATAPTTAPAGSPASSTPIFVHLDALESPRYSHGDRLADFAQRLVFARTANPQAILYDLLPAPRPSTGATSRNSSVLPDELLLVYRSFIHALGNSTFVSELSIAPGVRAFLFNRQGSGTLVLWSESGTTTTPLDLPLGATPRQTDLFGNTHPLTVDPASGLTHVEISATPFILDQLDPRPLQLKTSYALGTSNLPAGAGSVRTDVQLTNPYTDAISGTLRIQPPQGWSADPNVVAVNLSPGNTLHQPVTIRYPFTETAGPKRVGGNLSLEQAMSVNAQQLDLTVAVAVTSDQVELEGFSQMLDNGDIVVQQMITNITNRPLTAQAYVLLPGYARQQRYITDLPAGQTAIKRFTFPATTYVHGGDQPPTAADIANALAGKTATLGLSQRDGKTLITKVIPLE
jgi:hypothetical protein